MCLGKVVSLSNWGLPIIVVCIVELFKRIICSFKYLKDLGSVPCCLIVDRIMDSLAPFTNAVAASGVRKGVFLVPAESDRRPPLM